MTVRSIAALGSSFAAGPGLDPIVDRAARRSGRNYPHLLAERLQARLTDLTVSGATTATVLDQWQRTGRGRRPPQVEGLPADVDLITITVGGNDLRYAWSLLRAGWAGWLAAGPGPRPAAALARRAGARLGREAVAAVTSASHEAAVSGLAAVVDAARRRSPDARVLLVDYLPVIGPASTPGPLLPFDTVTLGALRELGRAVDEVFAGAAARTGAELVRASVAGADHAADAEQPWVSGFCARPGRRIPFHPNEEGMAAVADLIARRL